jgi:hypothetical protein
MDEVYKNGDLVFYKRPNQNVWRGPGRVLGQDGVVVFVRHGSQLMRVHVCRLRKEVQKIENRDSSEKQPTQKYIDMIDDKNDEENQQQKIQEDDYDEQQRSENLREKPVDHDNSTQLEIEHTQTETNQTQKKTNQVENRTICRTQIQRR